jgi:hypothetical protein
VAKGEPNLNILKFQKQLVFLSCLFLPSWLYAIGTYSEGYLTAKILQFESRGIIFKSYEGIMEVVTFDKKEKCDETKDECFTPTKTKLEFSVRPEKADLVNLLNKNVNQELLLQYRIHRIEAIALSSELELLSAGKQENAVPASQGDKKIVSKSGSKRNFAVSGKILQLDYQGTFIGTYEGLYMDEARGKVHPFSVTQADMAKYAWGSMKSSASYSMGISVAFATGFRKSNYDLFEINYKEPAGGVHSAKN